MGVCLCATISHISTLSLLQIAEFQEAFLLYDNRGDGRIAVSLIGDVMRALGQNPTESEVKKLVHEHRADDRVSFETFLPILQVRKSFSGNETLSWGKEGDLFLAFVPIQTGIVFCSKAF